jgi:uncharacterized membrane protein HdeD (DUF308 family)
MLYKQDITMAQKKSAKTPEKTTSQLKTEPTWWVLLLQGILLLFIGWFMLRSPITSIIVLVQVLGFYWIINGIVTMAFSFTEQEKEHSSIWKFLGGLIGIIAGIFVLNNRLFATVLTPVIFTYFIAFTFIINGVIEMFSGGKKTGSKWADFFFGLFYLLMGLMLLGMPLAASVMTVVFTLGLLAMTGGLMAIIFSFRYKK